jgi:hypothetical protein
MLMLEYRDIGWWYWLVTAALLSFGVLGNPAGFMLAIGLTTIQLVHYVIRGRSTKTFPIQVRFWYLMLLLIAWFEPLQWIYWIPAIGTWAQVIFGYCTMARCVSLFPWNRNEQLSFGLVNKTFFSRPVRGSIKQGFSATR